MVSFLCLTMFAGPAGSTQAARQGASKVLTIGELAIPTGLDPLIDPSESTADVTDALFDSLLGTDPHDALVPELATGYTISNHGLRYQFILNNRARWQDGEPVTADDVLFTTRLMRDPKFPAANRFGFGNIASISATGTRVVTVTLRAPYGPFLQAFASTPILPSHVLGPLADDKIADYTYFNQHPIGDGPYMLSNMGNGSRLTLTANPHYFLGAPGIDQLVFQLESSEQQAEAALRDGTVQLLGPSVGITPGGLTDTLQHGGLTAYTSPGYGWTHIDLIESGFLRDHVVRQALTYATPRQKIITDVFKGLVAPANADQPPTSQYYQPTIANTLPYDPTQVPVLLKQQGYDWNKGQWEKFGLPLQITLWTDSTCADCRTVASLVAANWSSVGISTTVHAEVTTKLFGYHGPLYNPDRLYSQQLNAVLYSWSTTAEPDDSFYWSSSMIVKPGNLTGGNFDGYSNAVTDRLISQALAAPTEQQRIALYGKIQSELVHDQPDIFLYWTEHFALADTALSGYRANPFRSGVTWNVVDWKLN
jgi:peptide/nickel transport system substrate-binding protein